MPNMSHCRFENTYRDLQDCFFHTADDDLSDSENTYRELLYALCQSIVEEYESFQESQKGLTEMPKCHICKVELQPEDVNYSDSNDVECLECGNEILKNR